MKKVLIFTSREGHYSIAKSISEILEKNNFRTVIKELETHKKSFDLYLPFYRYAPYLFQVPYKLFKREDVQPTIKKILERISEKEVKNIVKEQKPNLIISTNYLHNPAIAKVLDYQTSSLPFLNIITNPGNIHPLEYAQTANFNLIYDEMAIKIGLNNKIPGEKIISTGWFVRKQFYDHYNAEAIRKKLGFKENIFTLLVCGGSEGTNMILKIIPSLLTTKKSLQVIVICGTNNILYKAISSLKNIISKLKTIKLDRLQKVGKGLNLKVFKFSDKLAQYISVANLVVGKAGPNLLFETISGQKPFFAICHISGQEDANLDLIRKKKLGWVEENPLKATKLLHKIIDNPTMAKVFQKSIKKEYLYNKLAETNLLKIINQLL